MKRFAIALSLMSATALYAADPAPVKKPEPKHAPAIVDPAEAGPEYKLQGEYEGTGGTGKWGAQVIAMGEGTFRVVFETGGLPGAGWDGKTRFESEGKLDGDKVTITPTDKFTKGDGHKAPELVFKPGFTATLAGETLSGKTDAGDTIELKRTVRHSPTEGAKPPEGAIVLFDGSSIEAFTGAALNKDGTLKQGGTTKQKFTDFTLHVEFSLPYMPTARGQGRGNSGVYIQNKYETQVLDSFGLKGMDNECAGIYTKNAPLVNMCYPPLTWQTYDIDFTAARYEKGEKKAKAIITVKHNGVLVQDKYEVDGSTGGGQKEDPKQDVQSGPIYLQNHGNPVSFRNIWIVEKK